MPKRKLPSCYVYYFFTGRVSSSACKYEKGNITISRRKRWKGSITVEAALAVPIFFLAVVSLLYLMEIMAIQSAIRCGLQSAGKQAMEDAYAVTVLIPSRLEQDIVSAVGQKRLERSIVVGGSSGLSCGKSYMSAATGIGEVKVSYRVRLPIPVFAVPPIVYEESMRIKAWTGYERSGFGSEKDEIVYITETGMVYHKDYHCTHLELSIRMVQASEIDSLRNEGGGKYHKCESCGKGASGGVYITNTGDRYHSSLSCSGLKRTVYAVPISEAAGKGACSRCGG